MNTSEENEIKKRKYPRRPCNKSLGFLMDGNYVVQKAVELGEGGLLMEGNENLPINKKILITMFLSDQTHLITVGTTRYCRQGKNTNYWLTGIELRELDLSQKRSIRTYIVTLKDNPIKN